MSDFRQRGLAAAQARRPDEAAQWFEKALDETPGDPEIEAWYGQSLCATGQRLEGNAYLRHAGDTLVSVTAPAGDHIAKIIGIAVQLQMWGDMPGALALCRKLAGIAPENPQAHHLLAVCCGQMNLPDEALDHIRIADRLAPDQPAIQVLRGSLEADAGLWDDALQHLEQVLARDPAPTEKFRAHKELARILDKKKQYEQAFVHLQAADALARQVPEFQRIDWHLILQMLNANRGAYNPESLGRWAQESFADEHAPPVFVIGFYRSGTTLTQEVLATHPDVFVSDEAGLVHEMQRELARLDPSQLSMPAKVKRLNADQIRHLRAHYWTQARGRYGDAIDKPVFVDKFTMNTLDIGFINVVFPDAKVIFMVRDPRDVCLSCFMQLMVPSAATVHLNEWQGTANLYAGIMSWWVHISEQLTMPWLEVRYEDAVAEFENTYSEVLSFIGLQWDPALLDFHKRAAGKFISTPSRNQVSQPLYTSSVDRWRRYAPHFETIADRIDPFVEAYDYTAS